MLRYLIISYLPTRLFRGLFYRTVDTRKLDFSYLSAYIYYYNIIIYLYYNLYISLLFRLSQGVENIANEVQNNALLKVPIGIRWKKFDEMRK